MLASLVAASTTTWPLWLPVGTLLLEDELLEEDELLLEDELLERLVRLAELLELLLVGWVDASEPPPHAASPKVHDRASTNSIVLGR
jgi:hypothetical protein